MKRVAASLFLAILVGGASGVIAQTTIEEARQQGNAMGKAMRAMSDKAAHVERIANGTNQFRRCVDDGHVVLLGRQSFRNTEADLPRAANNDFHRLFPASTKTKCRVCKAHALALFPRHENRKAGCPPSAVCPPHLTR